MAWKKQTGTKHSDNCTRVFKRYDLSCPRCLELAKGSTPRESWSSRKDMEYNQFLNNLKAHNCIESNCGPICTAFDY